MATDGNTEQRAALLPDAHGVEGFAQDDCQNLADPNDDALQDLVRMVAANGLFDEAFYAQQAGITGSRAELVAHYLEIGEPALLSPSPAFDLRFYRHVNPDIVQAGGSPLQHYLLHGRAECRYPTWDLLRRDAKALEASGLFDAAVFAWNRSRPVPPSLSASEDYLVTRDHGVPVGSNFDSEFYQQAYDDTASHAMPILHYIAVGRAETRVPTRYELARRTDAGRLRFNERFYLGQFRSRFPGEPLPADPLRHYILNGCRIGLDPAPDFSVDYYLRLHPDMRTCGLDPFFHYAAHGLAEGRLGRPNFSSVISRGDVPFDLAKPTILVASHEASRTGAPLVGLNIGAQLAATHNVLSYLGRYGPLMADFAAHSCLMLTGPLSALNAEYLLIELKATHLLSAVLLNSAETGVLAAAALQADLPSVALVHEFAEYTVPHGRMSEVIERVDRVITPADLIEESVQAELLTTRAGHANNIMVRPQGTLPTLPSEGADNDLTRDEILALIGLEPGYKAKIVLGAGQVQMRKGVDLFVQTAAEMRRLDGDDIRFVWVGGGYLPRADLQYSAWVADMVRRLDLERHVFFLPAQSSLDTLLAMSTVFYLPSRLDPFPNVALHAFEAGRGVVCFDRATGVAAMFREGPGRKAAIGAAVDYCDVTKAAEALVRACRPAEVKRGAGNAVLAKNVFDFGSYLAVIVEQLAAAAALRIAAVRATDAIIESELFDASFHDNLPLPVDRQALRAAVREYVARSQKGLIGRNPRPGFNEGVARSRLMHPGPALGVSGGADTHRCVVLDDDARHDATTLRAALHLHLHYPELAAEFVALLAAARAKLDLVVTTTSDARRLEIEHAFRAYRGGSTQFIVVPNRGRDIGPFLIEAGRVIDAGQYDVVGHLHGKRSLAVDAALGDRWRSYLTGTLLGGNAGLPAVLSLFDQDPALGLVFAEDRHCVGWGKNRPFGEALAQRMTPRPELPDWPVFPIGTMFWARPAALAPLSAIGLTARDFPAEPAPYDGTVLHAIERILPSVCAAAGYGWCTVYRRGSGW